MKHKPTRFWHWPLLTLALMAALQV